jgi:iron complex transport system permease protein
MAGTSRSRTSVGALGAGQVEARRSGRRSVALVPLAVALPAAMLIALALGSVAVPLATTAEIIGARLLGLPFAETWTSAQEAIVLQLRLPRVVLAAVTGASLAMSGAVYQGLFRNPMGDPYLLGVAPGAGLGATIVIVFSLTAAIGSAWLLPAAALVGGLGATAVIYLIARVDRRTPVGVLLLAGVALGSLLSALTSMLMLARPDRLQHAVMWLFGSFSSTTWAQVVLVLPFAAAGSAVAIALARPLNLLLLDEEQASHLGVNTERLKAMLIVGATLLAAAPVAVSGLIGFVGLIGPHAARLLWSPDSRTLLPASALLGALFLVLADLFARTAFAPSELPVGVVSALCGGPFFLFLLRKRKRSSFGI